MAHVYARTTCILTVNGVPTSVRAGDKFDRNDDVVREHPGVFESPVEEATAVPGQKRSR